MWWIRGYVIVVEMTNDMTSVIADENIRSINDGTIGARNYSVINVS